MWNVKMPSTRGPPAQHSPMPSTRVSSKSTEVSRPAQPPALASHQPSPVVTLSSAMTTSSSRLGAILPTYTAVLFSALAGSRAAERAKQSRGPSF